MALRLLFVLLLAGCGGGGDDIPKRPLTPLEVCLEPLIDGQCPERSITNKSPGPQVRP